MSSAELGQGDLDAALHGAWTARRNSKPRVDTARVYQFSRGEANRPCLNLLADGAGHPA
jgi:hypothetical protein